MSNARLINLPLGALGLRRWALETRKRTFQYCTDATYALAEAQKSSMSTFGWNNPFFSRNIVESIESNYVRLYDDVITERVTSG